MISPTSFPFFHLKFATNSINIMFPNRLTYFGIRELPIYYLKSIFAIICFLANRLLNLDWN